MSGSVGWRTIEAVLVSVDGTTRIAHYRNGRKPDEALHVWSVTKSVTSALIGFALDEQIIGSLDQTLDELLPRYRRFMTREQKQISLRQLMDMTAGYPPDQPFHVIWEVFQHRHTMSGSPPCSPMPGRNSSTRWRLTPTRRTRSRWHCPPRCPTTPCLRARGGGFGDRDGQVAGAGSLDEVGGGMVSGFEGEVVAAEESDGDVGEQYGPKREVGPVGSRGVDGDNGAVGRDGGVEVDVVRRMRPR